MQKPILYPTGALQYQPLAICKWSLKILIKLGYIKLLIYWLFCRGTSEYDPTASSYLTVAKHRQRKQCWQRLAVQCQRSQLQGHGLGPKSVALPHWSHWKWRDDANLLIVVIVSSVNRLSLNLPECKWPNSELNNRRSTTEKTSE